jgi:hypothetical protein
VAAPLLLDKEGDQLEEAESDGAQVVGSEDKMVTVREGLKFLIPMPRLSLPLPPQYSSRNLPTHFF